MVWPVVVQPCNLWHARLWNCPLTLICTLARAHVPRTHWRRGKQNTVFGVFGLCPVSFSLRISLLGEDGYLSWEDARTLG